MFAVRLTFFLDGPEGKRPAPKHWLDQFFMRDFTGYRAFDETLPIEDGVVEASRAVAAEEAAARLQEWLRGRKLIDDRTCVRVEACDKAAGGHR